MNQSKQWLVTPVAASGGHGEMVLIGRAYVNETLISLTKGFSDITCESSQVFTLSYQHSDYFFQLGGGNKCTCNILQ